MRGNLSKNAGIHPSPVPTDNAVKQASVASVVVCVRGRCMWLRVLDGREGDTFGLFAGAFALAVSRTEQEGQRQLWGEA